MRQEDLIITRVVVVDFSVSTSIYLSIYRGIGLVYLQVYRAIQSALTTPST